MNCTETRIRVIGCPFTEGISCRKDGCDNCPIRRDFQAKEDRKIAANLRDYWKCQAAGYREG